MSIQKTSRYEAAAAQHEALRTFTAENGYPINGIGLTCAETGWAVSVNLTEPAGIEMPEQIKGVLIIYKIRTAPIMAQC